MKDSLGVEELPTIEQAIQLEDMPSFGDSCHLLCCKSDFLCLCGYRTKKIEYAPHDAAVTCADCVEVDVASKGKRIRCSFGECLVKQQEE